ncbi:putative aminoacyltransferase, E1 ubiquitin-activating enzyme [Medicago truncatula]|uniref:E3 ubiquitin-protein ligase RMA n=1 Tax=Medicago truncatula TaxID=3880 RepID=A0A396JSI3_MEDTR|nr:putative aminoacyltransferase, E1 ubiquitin-activating enzyme [Medicago truncatula]
MGEQTSTNAWNIDLNLLPSPEQLSGVMANGTMNLIDLVDQPSDRITETSNGGVALDKTSKKRKNVEKGGGSEGSVFDCNICLDLAKNPVVTCCGHLFCWPCLYRWLHLRSSQTKACPVCKGEVTDKNVIPIYGGENNVEVRHEDSSSTLQIPSRPKARHGIMETYWLSTRHLGVQSKIMACLLSFS